VSNHSHKLISAVSLVLASPFALAATGEPADEMSELVVTGIRSSVQAAQDIKRLAPEVVEAITSEDLGKFTDANITDALQRVPGINIERTDGTFDSGYGITIRGLAGSFSTSTLNGRELLGIPGFGGQGVDPGGRQFDFSTVPPEILSGVTVYKTSTANLVEPGLSGQVDMQTLRPLDYHKDSPEKYFGSVKASDGGAYDTQKSSPRVGGNLGAKLLDNTLGVYGAFLYSDEWANKDITHSYDGPQTITLDNGKTYPNALVPLYGYDFWRAHEKREKRSVALGVQWKPNSNIELNLDYLYNKSAIARRDQANYWYPSIGSGGYGSQKIPASAISLGGDGPGVAAWDATHIPGLTGYSYNYLGALHLDYVNTSENGGINFVWKSDDEKRKLKFDYADSSTDYTISWLHPYFDNSRTSTNLETVSSTGNKPVVSETNVGNGPNIADPKAYTSISFAEDFQKRNRGNRQAVRLDFDDELSESLLGRIGVRYAHTNSKFVSMDILASQTPTIPVFYPYTQQLPFLNFRTPVVNFDGTCAANPQFCGKDNFGVGSLVGTFPTSANGKPGDVLGFDPTQSFEMRETNTAVYAELDFKHPIFGINSSGNVGVRAVHINEDGIAFVGGCTKIGFDSGPCDPGHPFAYQLVRDGNSYWESLPSFNLNLMPRDNMNVRVGIGKSMTLPSYGLLAPVGTADIILPAQGGTTVGGNVATVGNAKLKPTLAWNYDLTGEYYTNYGGAYIASLFYKDVKDLIITETLLATTVPGQGGTLFDTTTSVNAASGKTYGAELGTNQPFTFLRAPWDGFGLEANYTYVFSKTNVSGQDTRFPGSSPNNVNVTGYYEKFGWSSRLAYSWRQSYLATLGNDPGITRAQNRLDASVSYRFNTHLEVIATGSNLTRANISTYSQHGGFVQVYIEEPSTYSLGIRGSF
jgi:iron complex outermembrane recepter protein